MSVFRMNIARNTFSLFMGLIILNMSFFLAEVSALGIDQNEELMENIVKLFAGCSEDDKDGCAPSNEENPSIKQINIFFTNPIPGTGSCSPLSLFDGSLFSQGVPRFGNVEIFIPPPELR